MTLWRPIPSAQERNIRAIRSMQSGSLDGRVMSAFPVKSSGLDEESANSEETTVGNGSTDDDTSVELLPYTDYFSPENLENISVKLRHTPWSQPDMPANIRSRASIHFYWNGIYQKDIAYSISGTTVIIRNPDLLVRPGDQLAVKYWYEVVEEESSETELIIPMECWLSSVEIFNDPGLWFSYLLHGTQSSPPTGQNYGTIASVASRFPNSMQFLSSWESRFRLPSGVLIPVQGVKSMVWMANYDPGASISIQHSSFSRAGTDYGETVGVRGTGGILGMGTVVGEIPSLLAEQPVGPFSPSKGPEGGVIFAEGSEAINLATIANSTSSGGGMRQFTVSRGMPPMPSDGTGCGTIICKNNYDVGHYDVRIGITCYVSLEG